jgi:hypothetical protein
MDPRAGLDDVEKRQFLILLGLELRPLRRPSRSQSLYRIRMGRGSNLISEYSNTTGRLLIAPQESRRPQYILRSNGKKCDRPSESAELNTT